MKKRAGGLGHRKSLTWLTYAPRPDAANPDPPVPPSPDPNAPIVQTSDVLSGTNS